MIIFLDTQVVAGPIFDFKLPAEIIRKVLLALLKLIEFALLVLESPCSIGREETPVGRPRLLLVYLRWRLNIEFLTVVDDAETFVDYLRLVLPIVLKRDVRVLGFESVPISTSWELVVLDCLVMLLVHLR